jgi:hypothetical protein
MLGSIEGRPYPEARVTTGYYLRVHVIVLREQARSHIWNAFSCGSELAREEALKLYA